MRISDWSSDVCSSDLDRPARPCRTLGLEREAFAPAIAFGGIAGRKPQLDLRQRVAATGPAGEGIGFGTPSRGKTQTPHARMRASRLIGSDRHRLADRAGGGRPTAGGGVDLRVISVGSPRPLDLRP